MSVGWFLVPAAIAGAIYVIAKGISYVEEDDVPPWRKFKIVCPVCERAESCWKRNADRRVSNGFGVHGMNDAPTCKRCLADLSEPYMRTPYVAALIAEAKRAEQFKATAAEYNAAIKATRKAAA